MPKAETASMEIVQVIGYSALAPDSPFVISHGRTTTVVLCLEAAAICLLHAFSLCEQTCEGSELFNIGQRVEKQRALHNPSSQ